ncbi:hypothetical protein D8674_034498 [Pyrus ussuriensis x Pyrus communis]|uniref:Peptidase S9 prolyl oligopeptidase catalytic domain-containing protein n=1 Tax=Pyrus ussuriensis x Pyrus communis TaxID=2448454 RepID=A0A5N5HSK4_9ROSA|nr:hypothetical protein D8674_034498 [Pyrus ussuriensis x Pyrus communis]
MPPHWLYHNGDAHHPIYHRYISLNFEICPPPHQMTTSSSLQAKQSEKIVAPYGSWKSPISADVVSGASKNLGGTAVDSLGRLIWLESRPSESGRDVLVREPERPEDEPVDITPKDYAVRTVAQEYGGGAFSIYLWIATIITYDQYGIMFISRREIFKRICVAGSDPSMKESPVEPKWSSKGELFFITDRKSGYWNLYKWVISVYSLDAEFSKPLWVFGMNSYEFIQSHESKNIIACSYRQKGRSYLGILDDAQGSLSLLNTPFTDIDNIVRLETFFFVVKFSYLSVQTLGINCLYVEGASEVTLDDHKMKAVDFRIIWSSSPDCLKYQSYFSLPEFIEFPTEVPGQTAFAYFYPPSNPNYQAPQGEKPPLLLKSHGGPTSESHGILNLSIQYLTSRGWAYVDVNYGGSTGYGREYRERLLNKWGIVDVNDCCSCARYLVDSGKVDGERLCITGGSAGGYTTLAALAFRDTFKAGSSLYGVADLNMLRAETHKFESHDLDNLVGSEKDFYDRSPINFVDKFSCPIILFQGLEDKEKGLPVAHVEYEGEQHGFRKAENIKFTLEQQMVFFARLVGHFKVADEINPIKIDNFD